MSVNRKITTQCEKVGARGENLGLAQVRQCSGKTKILKRQRKSGNCILIQGKLIFWREVKIVVVLIFDKVLIFNQILLTSNIRNIRRIVRRILMLIVGLKRLNLNRVSPSAFLCRIILSMRWVDDRMTLPPSQETLKSLHYLRSWRNTRQETQKQIKLSTTWLGDHVIWKLRFVHSFATDSKLATQ